MTETERRVKLGELFIKHWLYRFRDGGSTRCQVWGLNMPSTLVKTWIEIVKGGGMFFALQSEQSDKEFYNLREIRGGHKDLSLKMAEGLQEKYAEDTDIFYKALEEIYEDLQKDSTDK